jgi:3-oxoadipate CoA-transferase, beta subunit
MDLLTRSGTSKLVHQCTYPLTGLACVSRVYTDIAIFSVGKDGASVLEMADGVTLAALSEMTGLDLRIAAGV